MNQLTGQTVFGSGSAKGIGKAIAAAFINAEASTIVHSRSQSGVAVARDNIGATHAVWGS